MTLTFMTPLSSAAVLIVSSPDSIGCGVMKASAAATLPASSSYTSRAAVLGSLAAQITENDDVVTSVTITLLTSGAPAYAATGSTSRKNRDNHLILSLLFTLIVTPLLKKLVPKIHKLMFHKNKKAELPNLQATRLSFDKTRGFPSLPRSRFGFFC